MSAARAPGPDFLIVGAPKAGTSALHAALARHPQVHLTSPAAPHLKEPKYYLCDDVPPPSYRGPGDAHSNREWVWRRAEYEALFASAPADAVRGESTPFYLWSSTARRRIAEELPAVRLVVVLRDPVDRAYSNWMHLWSDGSSRTRTSCRPSLVRTRGSRLGGRRSGATGGSVSTDGSWPICTRGWIASACC